jgi:hypothetical protein
MVIALAVTGDDRVGISGRSFIGTARTDTGKGEHARPTFLNRYGHFVNGITREPNR